MSKLCQYCGKREAKIHFTEIKDGQQTEMHICEQCAHEKNVALAFPLLSHLVKGGPGMVPAPESDAVPATCPSCGLSYLDFKSKGRLGCPTCYTVFAPVLVPLLEKVHGAAHHVGNSPRRLESVISANQEARELRQELEAAIVAEEYEKAAGLRADAVRGVRAVYAKAWASPTALSDAHGQLISGCWDWTVTDELMDLGEDAAFLHCLPVRRNVVVMDSVLDGPRSAVYRQAGNRLHTARAALAHVLKGGRT